MCINAMNSLLWYWTRQRSYNIHVQITSIHHYINIEFSYKSPFALIRPTPGHRVQMNIQIARLHIPQSPPTLKIRLREHLRQHRRSRLHLRTPPSISARLRTSSSFTLSTGQCRRCGSAEGATDVEWDASGDGSHADPDDGKETEFEPGALGGEGDLEDEGDNSDNCNDV